MPKKLNIQAELDAMEALTPKQLREKYLAVFGEATRSGNTRFMIKRMAWRLQADAEGDLPERVRERALELARDSDLRTTAPRTLAASSGAGPTVERVARFKPGNPLTVGTQLTREYKGKTVVVTVLPGVPDGNGLTLTPGSANSTSSDAAAVELFAALLSGEIVATVLVAPRIVVPSVRGTVVVKVCVLLAPGVRLPTVKVCTSLLDNVTVPVTTEAAVPADPLLEKVTVPETTEPAGALPGRATVVVSSANSAPLTLVSVLFAPLLSGTVAAVTMAVTVPPVAVIGTVIGALVDV